MLEVLREGFAAEGVEMSDDEAEEIAMRAFGWKLPKKYWKGSRERQPPDAAAVETNIVFLKDQVGLSGPDFAKVVRQFPEVVGIDVGLLESNMCARRPPAAAPPPPPSRRTLAMRRPPGRPRRRVPLTRRRRRDDDADVTRALGRRGILTGTWRMKPKQVAKAVARKPEVLGNVLDCEGDCKGDCTRCWAQF